MSSTYCSTCDSYNGLENQSEQYGETGLDGDLYTSIPGQNVWEMNESDLNTCGTYMKSNVNNNSMSSMSSSSPIWEASVTTTIPTIPIGLENPVSNIIPGVPARRINPNSLVDEIPKVVDMSDTCNEYTTSKNKYMKASYSGKLDTVVFYGRVSDSVTIPFRYDHLNVFDILKYVTCGGVLSDSYKDSFLDYILSELKLNFVDVKEYSESVSRINGGIYNMKLPLIAWCDYALTAKLCLEWVMCNPEKLGRC